MGTITVKASGESATLEVADSPTQGPVSVTTARDPRLGVPASANLVVWKPEWTNLQQAFLTLAANDVLVLPERDTPYLLDASKGFLASGAASITDHGALFQGPMWLSLSRAKRGLVGLGPGARIEIAAGHRILGPQIPDSQGVPGAGRIVTFLPGGQAPKELVGCAEKMIECTTPGAYFGNFTIVAKNMGGVAYNMIALSGPADDALVERITAIDQQGFSAVPNGESGVVSSMGDRTTIRRMVIEDSGSSPIMLNSCTGTLLEDITTRRAKNGMVTLWKCHGANTFRRVRNEHNKGGGVNIEAPLSTFVLTWDTGAVLVDKPEGGYSSVHLKVGNGTSSIKLALRGVEFDRGPWPGTPSVQLYGSSAGGVQKTADITAVDLAGNPVALRFAGA